ncbi:MAG: hypothetical protein IH886_12640 [Nitrospinae bacterium]|nr:hypothetical protein [Nitrospinota bacterium]
MPESNQKFDVEDHDNLKLFLEKIKIWISWFKLETENSITSQIMDMVWEEAIFRVANEIRRIRENRPDEGLGINGPLSSLLDRGYVNLQSTAIRRLIDTYQDRSPRKGTSEGRDVISLSRLLREFKEEDNHKLFTRENYVCSDGLPYDYAPLEEESLKKELSSAPRKGPFWGKIQPWQFSQMRHETFDKLSVKKPDNRSRGDLIKSEIFDRLTKELEVCKDIKIFVDKYIAHSADPNNLIALNDDQRGVTLDRIEECHKNIWMVANCIYGEILGESVLGTFPTPQFDHLENLEKAWINKDEIEELQAFWDQHVHKVDNWPDYPI